MSNLKRKIVAVVTVLTVAGFVAGPSMAQATTIEDLLAQIAEYQALLDELTAQVAELQGETATPAISGCLITEFTRNLQQGMSGDDVNCLQIVLNSDSETQLAASGVGSPGSETSYFGPLTKAAVIVFQELYADEVLASWGLTSGTGFVGSTTRAKLNSLLTAAPEVVECETDADCASGQVCEDSVCVAAPTVEEAEGFTVALAVDTPALGAVAVGAYNVVFTKLKFLSDTDCTITAIAVKRNGVSDDNDVTDVRLFEDSTQLGTAQALNTITHKATFSGLSWALTANIPQYLTIKASINSSSTEAQAGNTINFGIVAAGDVVTTEGLTIEGVPVYGNAKTIAGVSVGVLDVDGKYWTQSSDTSITGDVISGATDQNVGTFAFTASSAEGFDVTEVILTEVGTSVGTDISNITLKYLGETIATVAELDADDEAVFQGDPLFTLRAGVAKDIDVYVDIGSGVISERTVKFEVTEAPDITAFGQNTGGAVVITWNSGNTFIIQRSKEMTIKQGTLRVALDTATNPSDQYYTIGATQEVITSFKFSAGSREGVKITKLKVTEGGTISDTEYQSVQLYIDGAETSTGHVGSISSGLITFTDSDGLFTVPKSANTVVTVKADITTAADGGDKIKMYISAITNITMKGAESDAKIYSDSSHVVLSGVGSSDVSEHEIKGQGNLTVSAAPDNPAGMSITLGDDDLTVFKFRLTAGYEDILVSSIKAWIFNDSSISLTEDDKEATSTGDIANVKLYDGATLLNEQSSPSEGYVIFSTNFTVTKDIPKTLSVVCDVPVGSTLQYLGMSVGDDTGGADADTDITSYGVSSAKNITETGGAVSNVFTLAAPALAVTAAASPPGQYKVTNTSGAWLGRLQLAGTNEAIKVTRVIITAATNTNLTTDDSDASTNFSNVYLKVGGVDVAGPKPFVNAGGSENKDIATFSGIEGLEIPKDQTVSLDIYADIVGTDAGPWYFGHASATDIVGSGLSSNTGVNSSGTSKRSQDTTIISAGTLTVSVDADTPIAANNAVGLAGKTGVDLAKIKFEALYEDIRIKTLKLTLITSGGLTPANSATTTAGSYDFNIVYLYDGTEELASQPITDSTVLFTKDIGLFTVPNGGDKVITVKADLYGLTSGAFSGDSPVLYITQLQDTTNILIPEGASSNASTTVTDGTPNPEDYSKFGAQWMYRTIITVDKNASSPSGAATAGNGAEVLRFDVTADAQADPVVNTVALTVSGSADLSTAANGYAYLCDAAKTNCAVNYLAREGYVAAINQDYQGGIAGFATSSSSTGFDGIPIGATLHIYSTSTVSSGAWYSETVLAASSTDAGVNTLIFTTTTLTTALSYHDDVYYQPLQPGPGKLYFGAMTTLTSSTCSSGKIIRVTSADGFAVGDTIRIKGYDSSGNATTSEGTMTIEGIPELANQLLVDNIDGAFDYDYNVTGGATDAKIGQAIVYTVAAANNIEEAISKGKTKTFVVKGDTTGADATANWTIRTSIANVSDLTWDDKYQFMIDARTLNLPITGGTLRY